jgi:catechol 2,3-dioxygenase-like lactoylglutathione lyase family enzyme
MSTVSVRYIVDDVAAAIGFYTERLGFTRRQLRGALPAGVIRPRRAAGRW